MRYGHSFKVEESANGWAVYTVVGRLVDDGFVTRGAAIYAANRWFRNGF